MRRNRGVTLIELLVAIAVLIFVVAGAGQAFSAVVAYHTQTAPARERREAAEQFERELDGWISRAYLGTTPTNGEAADRYFVAFDSGTGTGETAGFPDTLAFTAIGRPVDGAYQDSVDEDFSTRNARYGPQGGPVEVGISLSPVGETTLESGLFLRQQRPPDAEPFQGGRERRWREDITGLGFEFWNGTTWVTEWDTTTEPEPRLPGAVRVTYTLEGEPEARVRVFRVPLSDVTADNPAGVGDLAP